LLYFGDFLGAYGLIGLLFTLVLLPRSPKVDRIVLVLWALSLANFAYLAATLTWTPGTAQIPLAPVASLTAGSYWESLLLRLREWPAHTLEVLPFGFIVWLGLWAGRRRILEERQHHRPLLLAVAVAGLALAFLGGIPLALASLGWLRLDQASLDKVFLLHQVAGTYAGPGYVALCALIAHCPTGLSRLGRCSLSAYLFQSLVWLIVFSPFALHWGARSLSAACLVALLTWLAALLFLQRFPGPAERLMRRLIAERSGRPSAPAPGPRPPARPKARSNAASAHSPKLRTPPG